MVLCAARTFLTLRRDRPAYSRAVYGNRTRLLGLGSRCTTDVLTPRACINTCTTARIALVKCCVLCYAFPKIEIFGNPEYSIFKKNGTKVLLFFDIRKSLCIFCEKLGIFEGLPWRKKKEKEKKQKNNKKESPTDYHHAGGSPLWVRASEWARTRGEMPLSGMAVGHAGLMKGWESL